MFHGCDGEINETDSSLDFAKDCGYITPDQHFSLAGRCQEVGKMIGSMVFDPNPFLLKL